MKNQREAVRLVFSHRQREGGGFIVRRPFPAVGLAQVDPFLLVDELGPIDYAPGKAIGAPDHPHRGFETVTYVLEGELEHEDSGGARGFLGAGDVQWMTAGKGVVHAEMPSRRMQEHGGRVHGFQVWVNLPRKDKFVEARYQELKAAQIPKAQTPDGLAKVTIIAGEALGQKALTQTHTPLVYQHWSLSPGAVVQQPLPAEFNGLVYVFEGEAQVGTPGRAAKEGTMAILGGGDAVTLAAQVPTQLLLLAGVPLNEPMVRWGPFVMNEPLELEQAAADFQNGKMGAIRR